MLSQHVRAIALAVPLLAGLASAKAADPTAPVPAERKAILDAARSVVEQELGKKVIFRVDHLKTIDGWAHLRGVPLDRSGSPMDYKGTPYADAAASDAFDDAIMALLRKENGAWKVIAHDIGATDAVFDAWDKEFGAPRAILE